MRIERLSTHKFKMFLTTDDLTERGLETKEIWKDLPKVHQIFSDMILDAQEELEEELIGVLTVQIYMLQAQGLLVIVTKSEDAPGDDDFLEMKVTLDEYKELLYYFEDVEDVIQATEPLRRMGLTGGTLFKERDGYYLLLEEHEVENVNKEDLVAVLSEFGSATAMTSVWLEEYGVKITDGTAVDKFSAFF
ncbi:adaptor protein MecA [Salimicrobium humidisoli]|uniref:Adapter protein mecA n=1 Tax=Salimicrobium humidisoli TaxID=2029857 RepID=A0ABX4HQH8_9BACI|nr:adaptor protein MecA [Salimicrobium humidisoli]PBB05482.1 adapter protein mecA [Salimicrobium humidisoli]